jgi:hypothetical protein
MAEVCSYELDERTSLTLTVEFADEDGAPVTPSAATYRLDRLPRTSVLPVTAFPSLSASVDLEITSDQNQIFRSRNAYEIQLVTVEFDYGVNKHGTKEYRYKINSLYGVVTVPSPSVSPSASASPSV